jgi:hypothetical protein
MPIGDEEQPEQHVAEGLDVFFHLVLVLGLGNQHAGHEGAQRHRQAGALGDPGRAQRHQQQVEHEQLLRAALDHDGEPAAHQLLAEEQQQHQHDDGLDAGPGQRFRQFSGGSPARGSGSAAAPRPDPGTAGCR